MEINPDNDIIIELKKKSDKDASDNIVKNLIWLLYETSLLTSGFALDEPSNFAGRVYKMIKLGLSDKNDSEADDTPALVTETPVQSTNNSKMEDVDWRIWFGEHIIIKYSVPYIINIIHFFFVIYKS